MRRSFRPNASESDVSGGAPALPARGAWHNGRIWNSAIEN